MNEKLRKYIEMELSGFHKEKRNQIITALIEEIERENLCFDEIVSFVKKVEKHDLVIRRNLFNKILLPLFEREIEQNNLKAIKLLLSLGERGKYKQSNLIFISNRNELIEKGLQISPDDEDLLKIFVASKEIWLIQAKEELDYYVSKDSGRDSENLEYILKFCGESHKIWLQYKTACAKLSRETLFIVEKDSVFSQYKKYLQNLERYDSFECFLNSK
jgi:hypothetical protein